MDGLVENLPGRAVVRHRKQHLHHAAEVLRQALAVEVFYAENGIDNGLEQAALGFFFALRVSPPLPRRTQTELTRTLHGCLALDEASPERLEDVDVAAETRLLDDAGEVVVGVPE